MNAFLGKILVFQWLDLYSNILVKKTVIIQLVHRNPDYYLTTASNRIVVVHWFY